MENKVIYRFLYGYEYGVDQANDEADVQVQFAGTFADAAKGKSIANQMYSNKVDIILSAAGGTGLGAIESAKQTKKSNLKEVLNNTVLKLIHKTMTG